MDRLHLFQLSVWLWFLVLAGHMLEVMTAGQHAMAKTKPTCRSRVQLLAKKICCEVTDSIERVSVMSLDRDDIVLVESGDMIPVNGRVVSGTVMLNEFELTGQRAPVVRDHQRACQQVRAGSMVVLGSAKIQVEQPMGEKLFDKLWTWVDQVQQARMPHATALIWVFILATVMLTGCAATIEDLGEVTHDWLWLSGLLIGVATLLPAALMSLLSAVALQGKAALKQRNILVKSSQSIFQSAEVDTVVLDSHTQQQLLTNVEQLHQLGLHVVMVTEDHPVKAAALAEKYGVDDFVAQADAQTKYRYIQHLQAAGRSVALYGSHSEDTKALAQADLGIAMVSGAMDASYAADMIDYDTRANRLCEVLTIGRDLLPLRQVLTSLRMSMEMVRYFVVLSILSMAVVFQLQHWHVMQVHSAYSMHAQILTVLACHVVILFAVIPSIVPLMREHCATACLFLRKKLVVAGGSCVLASVVGIKLIDMLLVLSRLC